MARCGRLGFAWIFLWWSFAFARTGADSLENSFAAAKKDPAKVATLILEASRAIPETPTDTGHRLAERLRPYLVRAFFSPETLAGEASLGVKRHEVRKGDRPTKIGARYGFDGELLAKLNSKFDPKRLKIGSKLKVLDLSDRSLRIVIDRKRFRLALWRTLPATKQRSEQHLLIGYFPIACGAQKTPTPVGVTRICVVQRHPSWRNPKTGKVYGPHDPGNVLGGYWLGLDAKLLGKKGYGIHGYSGAPAKQWIGKAVSNGCVRMVASDIERVFRVVRVGTKVRIV